MKGEKFDFYDSSSIKIYNLDQKLRYELMILDNLDAMTKVHCENVGNLTGRICQPPRPPPPPPPPKEILTKDGPLTEEEFEVMKTHTTIGYNVCMRDLKLRPYADGPLYHHEALNGSGYPSGLTQKDIPFVARIIRVADEYDALVTKRHYTTHDHISDTLKDLIKDTLPEDEKKIAALGQLSENSNVGKISPKILRTLCKLVIEDTIYEISIVCNYVDYLKENIKRLELIDS